MNEITPQDVVDAYQKTGYRAILFSFKSRDENNQVRCCPMTALYVAKGGRLQRVNPNADADIIIPMLARKVGCTKEFASGVIAGWDGFYTQLFSTESLEFIQGFRVGWESRKMIFQDVSAGHLEDLIQKAILLRPQEIEKKGQS